MNLGELKKLLPPLGSKITVRYRAESGPNQGILSISPLDLRGSGGRLLFKPDLGGWLDLGNLRLEGEHRQKQEVFISPTNREVVRDLKILNEAVFVPDEHLEELRQKGLEELRLKELAAQAAQAARDAWDEDPFDMGRAVA